MSLFVSPTVSLSVHSFDFQFWALITQFNCLAKSCPSVAGQQGGAGRGGTGLAQHCVVDNVVVYFLRGRRGVWEVQWQQQEVVRSGQGRARNRHGQREIYYTA